MAGKRRPSIPTWGLLDGHLLTRHNRMIIDMVSLRRVAEYFTPPIGDA